MRILHVLDHSLPLQSGYTFRTRAILKAQGQRGFAVAGVTGARQLLTMTRAGTPAYGGGVGCSLTADGQTAAFTSSSVQLGSMEKDYDPDVLTLDINGSVFP